MDDINFARKTWTET